MNERKEMKELTIQSTKKNPLKGLDRFKSIVIAGMFFWMALSPLNAQESENSKLEIEYYKIFKENFYKEDEFLEQISNPDEEESFFMVQKNQKGKVMNVGYYNREGDSLEGNLKLVQYVNFEGLPYYYVNYLYDNRDFLLRKEFRDQNENLISYYQYEWNDSKGQLRKVEKYRKTQYLGKMELKSYQEYQWEGETIKTFQYYDRFRKPIEKYFFTANPDSGENKDSIFLVGNNRVSMFVLSRYERFKNVSKTQERDYYILYTIADNKLLQERYNHDDVLVEELPALDVPEDNDSTLIEELDLNEIN